MRVNKPVTIDGNPLNDGTFFFERKHGVERGVMLGFGNDNSVSSLVSATASEPDQPRAIQPGQPEIDGFGATGGEDDLDGVT